MDTAKDKSLKPSLIRTVTLAGLLPSIAVCIVYFATTDTPARNEPLHSVLEMAGAAAAIGVTSLLCLRMTDRAAARHFIWVCAALILMGIIDTAHAALPFGLAWSWTRHISTLVGGVVFACVWIPVSETFWTRRRPFIFGVIAMGCLLAFALCRFSDVLPIPYTGNNYTFWPTIANAVGGVGFFISTFFFLRRYVNHREPRDLTFAGLTLLFTISGMLFGIRGPWSAVWWMWHALRFLAYATVAYIGFSLSRALNNQLIEQKRTLQSEVEQRTEALQLRTQALTASEQQFRGIFETANEGIWILDENARIQLVNPRMCEMLGYSREELLNQSKWDFVAENEQATIREHFERRRRGIAEQFEVRFCRKDGNELWALIAARPIFENGQFRGTLDLITDNTERKRIGSELSQAKDALQKHAETLEAQVKERTAQLQETIFHLESFSYSITHDMRAPLRAITGYAHELSEEHAAALSPHARNLLDQIRKSALRLDRLIRDVLNYGRLTRGEFPLERVNLSRLLREVVREYPEFKEHEHGISIDCHDIHVWGNAAALTQCISNLVGNALKFVAPGVVPHVRIWCERHNHCERLWVADNGIGISPEHQKRIFGVFQRLHTNEAYPGTGIGLAIVQKAIERMGGKLGVESEVGKGSRFWFELPISDERKD